jgi:lipopolysaccharide transport system ATP-binding protein
MTRAEIRARFDEIVEFSEISRFLDTPVKRYSSGMYVRLAFAVAAHLDPEILIVDEVLAVGDAEFQKKCLGKMGEVAEGGRTVVFVSHNMGAVNRLCSTAVLLDAGIVRARGDVHGITSEYLHGGGLSPAEREWLDPSSSPGDDVARLQSVRVLQEGRVSATVDIRLPVTIEMEYKCLREGSRLVPIFSLFDDQGLCLFVSADFEPTRLIEGLPVGLHVCRCTIPGNTLAECTVLVVAEVSTSYPAYEIRFLEWDVVSFQVVDHGEPGSVRNGWGRSLLGAMRPECAWEFEFRGHG